MTTDTINKKLEALEHKICLCCGKVPDTDGPPTEPPSGDQDVKFDRTTGTFYYWDGDSWESVPIGTPGIDSVLAVAQSLSATRNLPLNGNQLTFTGLGSFGQRWTSNVITIGRYLGSGAKMIMNNLLSTIQLLAGTNLTGFTITDSTKEGYFGATGNNAKFGINTTSPTKSLDVLGTGGFTGDVTVPAEVYGVAWDGSLEVPTKNDVYDEMETKSDVGHTHVMSDVTDLPVIAYGTFNPGLNSLDNVSGVGTSADFFYTRIGNIVHISGSFSATTTLTGFSKIHITNFPVSSVFAAETDLSGVITTEGTNPSEANSGAVYWDSGETKPIIKWYSKNDGIPATWRLEATYIVI